MSVVIIDFFGKFICCVTDCTNFYTNMMFHFQLFMLCVKNPAVGCGACMGANARLGATDTSIGNNSCRGCFGKTGRGTCYKLMNSIVSLC